MSIETFGASRFQGKRALVTGAAGAMGRATALRLAGEGAHVALLDFREQVHEVAEEVAALGGKAVGIECNVGDEASVAAAAASTLESLGGLDVVVAAAGMTTDGTTHEIDLASWELVVRVNLTGVFLTVKHTVPMLLDAGGGAIVTIASTGAHIATGTSAMYDASKAGVTGFTRFIADEYASRNIRANAISPGLTASEFAANSALLAHPDEPDFRRSIPPQRLVRLETVPQRRRADASEIASVVAFLASDDASFVTGATINVDGGFTAT